MSKLLKFTHSEDFTTEIAYLIQEKILDVYDKNGLVRLALSGGNTPLPIYEKLAQSQVIPWDRVEIYQVDERYADSTNPDSNQGSISKIFGPVCSFFKEFVTWNTSITIQESSKQYNQYLESVAEEDDFLFDLVILGMGNDGHTASLFPKDPALDNTQDWSIFTLNTDSKTPQRLSLTYKSLLNTDDIFLLLTGEEKLKTLDKVLGENIDFHNFPIRKIIDEHQNTTIFILIDEQNN
jgi:6-phosphogluconolactonase